MTGAAVGAVVACLLWVYLGIPVLDWMGMLPHRADRYGAGENLLYALVLIPATAATSVLVLVALMILYGVTMKGWRTELLVLPVLVIVFGFMVLGLGPAWRDLP